MLHSAMGQPPSCMCSGHFITAALCAYLAFSKALDCLIGRTLAMAVGAFLEGEPPRPPGVSLASLLVLAQPSGQLVRTVILQIANDKTREEEDKNCC